MQALTVAPEDSIGWKGVVIVRVEEGGHELTRAVVFVGDIFEGCLLVVDVPTVLANVSDSLPDRLVCALGERSAAGDHTEGNLGTTETGWGGGAGGGVAPASTGAWLGFTLGTHHQTRHPLE